MVELPVSNIAYLFYRNLKEEKKNYAEIRTQIELKNGTIFSDAYETKKLEIVEQHMKIIDSLIIIFNSNKHDDLKPRIKKVNFITFKNINK